MDKTFNSYFIVHVLFIVVFAN